MRTDFRIKNFKNYFKKAKICHIYDSLWHLVCCDIAIDHYNHLKIHHLYLAMEGIAFAKNLRQIC